MKEEIPYLEHSKMMNRLVKLTHFCPINYLAITLLEETGHLVPSRAEIETIEAQIRTNLALKKPSLKSNVPTECLAELPHFCPINYLAILLLEEAGNLDPSMAEIETMEIRVKISLARVKGTLPQKVVIFPRAKSA